MPHDIVIRNGTLVDGTGSPGRQGDLALDGDRITAIGEVPQRGRREINAEGKHVTPGFVDIHTHLDAQIAWDPIASSSCYHGITSAVIGNCGVTFAPCKPSDRDYLARMMESVEDIPRDSINAGLPWDWETYGEYLASIDRMDKGVNVGGMVGHCAVRVHAMGERSLSEDPAEATDDDIARMCDLVDEAIGAGALGFSTSRTRSRTVATCPAPTPTRRNSSPWAASWAATARASSKARSALASATARNTCPRPAPKSPGWANSRARTTSAAPSASPTATAAQTSTAA